MSDRQHDLQTDTLPMVAMRQQSRSDEPAIRVQQVSRDYLVSEVVVPALRNVSFEMYRGELVALRGRSGSGKTSLLNIIGGLDVPTTGSVCIDRADITTIPEDNRVRLRRHKIGFIFQAFGLIPMLTAAENVEVALRLTDMPVAQRDIRVRTLLTLVGLSGRMKHRPHELSGGEQQRVAIARALANSPEILLADEPTGQLDSQTGRTIMTLLRTLVDSEGVTALVATHDPVLIDLADRVITISDGQIVGDVEAEGHSETD